MSEDRLARIEHEVLRGTESPAEWGVPRNYAAGFIAGVRSFHAAIGALPEDPTIEAKGPVVGWRWASVLRGLHRHGIAYETLPEGIRAALAAGAAVGIPDDAAGTTTHCPLTGVHEHAFRGPHRFHEWEPDLA